MNELNEGSGSASCKIENETAISELTANVKTISPVYDAEAHQIAQLKESIAMLEQHLVDLYSYHMRLFGIEALEYRNRIAENRKALAELQLPGCFGRFDPSNTTRCDTCLVAAKCYKVEIIDADTARDLYLDEKRAMEESQIDDSPEYTRRARGVF